MPSILHDAILEFLRTHHHIVLRLLTAVGVHLPRTDRAWREGNGELCDPACTPATFRADVTLVAYAARKPLTLAERLAWTAGRRLRGLGQHIAPRGRRLRSRRAIQVVNVEVQLGRDRSKSISLPIYVAGLRRRYDCCARQALLSPSTGVIRWAERSLFPDEPWHVPLLIGPYQIPPVLDLEEAQSDPAWAAITACLHARSPDAVNIARIALTSFATLSTPKRFSYTRLVMAGLTREHAAHVKANVPPALEEPISEYEKESYLYVQVYEEGEAKGLRTALLIMLADRGLEPTPEQLTIVQQRANLDRLRRWIGAANHVQSIEELLALDA